MIDLHTHSTISDGTYSPTTVVQLAQYAGVSVLALTDHDTIDGVNEAKIEATKLQIKLIHGVEITIERSFGDFHLLGYGMKLDNPMLSELLKNSQKNRENRNIKICELMNEAGIKIDYDKFRKENIGMIGRPHFANFLKEQKKVKTVQEGFDRYLATGKPFCVKSKGANLDEAIEAIKASNGVPIIAHPMSLYLSWSKLPDEIKIFKSKGIIGLEAWNAGTRANDCRRLELLAKDLGLIVTAGSDFHGKNKTGHDLGKKVTGEPINDYFYTDNLATVLI